MIPRFHIDDLSTVAHYLGTLACCTALLMLVPAGVGWLSAEWAPATDFLFGSGATMLLGAVLRLAPSHGLDRRRLLLIVGLAWILIGALAAFPLWLGEGFDSPLDALYDAVSALTTTGLSISEDIDHAPAAANTWRCLLTIAGGQGFVMVALYLGLFNEGVGVASKLQGRGAATLRSGLKLTGVTTFALAAAIIAAGTAVATVVLLQHGLTPSRALLNAFWLIASAYDTGGFVPHASGIIYYHSLGVQALVAPFMLMGALNGVLFALALRGRLRLALRADEVRGYGAWLVALVAVVTFILTREGTYTTLAGLLSHGAFMVLSAATTSGMQTVYPEQLGDGAFAASALIIIMLAAIVGGCSGSTSGGIKMGRVTQLVRWMAHSVRATLLPARAHTSITYEQYGTRRLEPEHATAAMTILFLYVLTAAAGAMVFIGAGYSAVAAIGESISHVSNAGISCGIVSAQMSAPLKVMCILQMWAGRLEFIALFAALVGLAVSVRPRMPRVLKKRRGRGASSAALCVLVAGALVAASVAPCAWADEETAAVGESVVAEEALAEEVVGEESTISELDAFPELPTSSKWRKVSIGELVGATAGSTLDGKQVKFSGEVVGEAISAGQGQYWINLLADGKMIGVLVSAEQLALVKHFGGYTATGETLVVKGTFHVSCAGHSGDLEVHAASLRVKAAGCSNYYSWDAGRARAGAGMLGCGLALWLGVWAWRRRHRRIRLAGPRKKSPVAG